MYSIEQLLAIPDSVIKKAKERLTLEDDFYSYVKWSFEKKKKCIFIENWHHQKICEALTKVYTGEIKNLIINLPPRYSKTEIAVKAFIEWCLAKNGRSKFIHLTYSDMLALDNSAEIREDIKSDWYQEHWPMDTKKDKDSKQKWETSEGGGVYATGTQGSITGFGAGEENSKQFAGAIIIDDPHKPDEASSDGVRKKDNNRLNNTILSRRNCTNGENRTPVIIIMQRLHEDDMTGFCLTGNTSEEWHHLCIPAISEEGEALWPLKHTFEQLQSMERADRQMFSGQYMQRPAPVEGLLCKREWIKFYMKLPERFDGQIQAWDFSVKDKTTSDFTAGGAFGRLGADKYFIDLVHAKMDFPKAQKALVDFSNKHRAAYKKLIEDKANGSPILQTLKSVIPGMIAITPIHDKVFRFNSVLPDIEAGNFYLPHPSICPWTNMVIDELCTFPNSKNDDIVDIVSMALTELRKAAIVPAPVSGHGSGVVF